MGGTCNLQLLKIIKSIWNYLLSHQITITAEYLPSRLNVRADWESRNAKNSSDSPTYGMEVRSKQFCNRCNAAGLEENVCFCIPTLQLDRSGDKQGSSGKCRSNDTRDTHMADTTLVYLHVQETRFHCRLRIGLEQVG